MKYLLILLLLALSIGVNGQRRQYKIGDTAFCGVVFYIEDSAGRQHGLVAALEDQEASIRWNNGSYITTNAFKDVLFDRSNAERVVARLGADSMYAAIVCAKYFPQLPDTFCDTVWYLPSKAELLMMYQNLKETPRSKFANEGYWTSVEYRPQETRTKTQKRAWIVDFLNGKSFPVNKANKYHVRAIREFSN